MRKPVRRLAKLVALVAVVGLAVSGCGSGKAGDSKTTLVLGVRSHFVDQLKQIAQQYATVQPNVTLQIQTLPDDNTQYLQRLVTEHLGGKMPDIIENIDSLVNQMSANNLTADLTPYLAKKTNGVSASTFLPQFLNAYKPLDSPDRIDGLPVGADAYVLYYNKDLFAKYGVALPTDTWTWDDMYAAAKKITQAAHGQAYGMVATDPQQPEYNPVIQAFGGFVYNKSKNVSGIGGADAIKAWNYMLKPYRDGTFASYQIGSSASAPTFQSGKVAMLMGARKNVPTFRQQLTANWDVAPIPLLNGKRPIGGGSYGLSISQTSKNKDAAYDFLSWFFSANAGEDTLQKSYQILPPTQDGVTNGVWKTLAGPPTNVSAFGDAAQNALMAPQLPKAAQGVLTTALITADQQVLLHGQSVQKAFSTAQSAVNAALKQK